MGIFLPRQEVFSPVGLVTQPSQYAHYPSGAGRVVRNVTMRNPGELVQAPGIQGSVSVGGVDRVIHKQAPLDNGEVYSFCEIGTVWSVFCGVNTASFIGSNVNAFSSTGRISWARVAERLLVNGTRGFLVGDYMAPTSAAERALRTAGLPQLNRFTHNLVDTGNGWLLGGQMVAYRFCVVRELANGYTLRSVPSPPYKAMHGTLTSAGTNPRFDLFWVAALDILAGDKIEVYRTDALATTNYFTDPGSTYKRVFVHTITSAEAAANFVQFKDTQPYVAGTTVSPGEELYTNPGQEGELYANRRPPIAKCVTSFKGFAFYGHTTERAQWRWTVPGGFGRQSEAVAAGLTAAGFKQYGIGNRTGAGTVSIGSPTITGVSAADMVGIVPGQRWFGGGQFVFSDRVLSVTATTITMSANALANGTTFSLIDMFEINGTLVYLDGAAGMLTTMFNAYEVTGPPVPPTGGGNMLTAFEYTVETNLHPLDTNITIRGTNGQNYSPAIPEIGATVKTIVPITSKNRIAWAKEQQPEHAPSVSEDFVGFGELYAMESTRDAVWLACSDGVFRLSGDAGALGLGNWQRDYANSTLILAGPQAMTALNESVYGYFNSGFCEVDSAGTITNLTNKVVGDVLPGTRYSEDRGLIVERNETDDEVLLALGENADSSSNTVYVFNTSQRGWTYLNGAAALTRVTAISMQRAPLSGEARVLFAISVPSGTPSFGGWNSQSSFLEWDVQYQPLYGDDPLELKNWIWCDYLFSVASAGRNVTPVFNGTPFAGVIDVQALDAGAYARAGVPREAGQSQSISPGVRGAASATQARFQGLSMALKQRTNQSKKR